MCLPGAPLSIKRKLVASFVCPVLYGSCFSRVPVRAWGALCNKVWRLCFGRTRYAASHYLCMGVCYGAHLWMPHAWSIAEMTRVIHTIASTATGKARLARLTAAFSPKKQSNPLVDAWISWCKTFGGEASGAKLGSTRCAICCMICTGLLPFSGEPTIKEPCWLAATQLGYLPLAPCSLH
eukprot:5059325-Amphidinium_carterae.2